MMRWRIEGGARAAKRTPQPRGSLARSTSRRQPGPLQGLDHVCGLAPGNILELRMPKTSAHMVPARKWTRQPALRLV